jgi:hypothetical protein
MKFIPKSSYMRHRVTTRNASLKTSEMDARLQCTATAACSGLDQLRRGHGDGKARETSAIVTVAISEWVIISEKTMRCLRGGHQLSAAKPSSTCRPCEVNRVRVHLFVGLRPF